MRSEVVLVRHARPLLPKPGGPDDYQRSLTVDGMAQARRLVVELSAPRPAGVVSSPYRRAVQTVEPLARDLGLPVRIEHDLREWDSGIEPTPDFAAYYADSWASPMIARPGAESLQQLTDRAVAVLTLLAGEHADQVVVVGSHGTFIARALVGLGVSGVDWPFSMAMPMPAIFRVRFADGRVTAAGPGI